MRTKLEALAYRWYSDPEDEVHHLHTPPIADLLGEGGADSERSHGASAVWLSHESSACRNAGKLFGNSSLVDPLGVSLLWVDAAGFDRPDRNSI